VVGEHRQERSVDVSPAESLVEDALTVAAGELAAGRPDAAYTALDAVEDRVGAATLQARASDAELLAVGRYHLARHQIALAAAKPAAHHARVAVRVLRAAARGADPEGRASALLAEAAVACCAGAGFLLRAQMIVIADRAARAALAKRNDLGEAHAALGVLALNSPGAVRERAREAQHHLAEAVRAQPSRVDWRIWLARAHRDSGDRAGADSEIALVRSVLRPEAARALIASILEEGDSSPPTGTGSDRVPPSPSSERRPRGGEPAIRTEGLRRGYGARPVLRGVDFEVAQGEIVGLVGPNGAGKSTLLGAISGRVAMDAGGATVLGVPVSSGRMPAGLGYAPQNAGLYPLLTVREHLACFARLHGLTGRVLARRVEEALDWSGLTDRSDDLTRSLSGGMRRRLVIAVAAVHSPPALLLDEPMTGIDAIHRERIWSMLRAHTSSGAAIVCAAPHLDEISSEVDRVVELVDGVARSRDGGGSVR
jgi:ABC-type Mn2+/Zn2+ transport system ATPase subunit